MRAIALLAACALALPAAAGWVRVTLTPVAGATAIRSGCTAAGQYERPAVAIAGNTVTIAGLPDAGRCYFALNAGPQDEWSFDFTALSGGRALPGQVRNLDVTWSPTPPAPAVSVSIERVENYSAEWDEHYLTIVGNVAVSIALSGTTCIDWLKLGTQQGAVGGTVVPTTPSLGANNADGNSARTFSVTGPVNRARADFDCSAFNGANVTVSGVTKPLVRSGTTWTVSF